MANGSFVFGVLILNSVFSIEGGIGMQFIKFNVFAFLLIF